MDTHPYAHLSKGSLLIASPEIDEGFYFRSVLLICEHGPNGSFALAINKPIELVLPEEILNLKQANPQRIQMRAGGPIQTNQMMLIHSSNKFPDQTMQLCEGVHLGGDMQFLQEAISEESGPQIRLCFGYSGWTAGLLEREFLNGNWFLHPASARLVFEAPPEKLWQSVLREMGGKYATLSMIPEDLSLN